MRIWERPELYFFNKHHRLIWYFLKVEFAKPFLDQILWSAAPKEKKISQQQKAISSSSDIFINSFQSLRTGNEFEVFERTPLLLPDWCSSELRMLHPSPESGLCQRLRFFRLARLPSWASEQRGSWRKTAESYWNLAFRVLETKETPNKEVGGEFG